MTARTTTQTEGRSQKPQNTHKAGPTHSDQRRSSTREPGAGLPHKSGKAPQKSRMGDSTQAVCSTSLP